MSTHTIYLWRRVILLVVFIVVMLGSVANWFSSRMTQTVAYFKQEILDDRGRINAEMLKGLKQMEKQHRAFEAQMLRTLEKRDEERWAIRARLEEHGESIFQDVPDHLGCEEEK